MNTWNDVLKEIEATKQNPQSPPDCDKVRRSKMMAVKEHTKRPLIVYAVDFLNELRLVVMVQEYLWIWLKEGLQFVVR